MFRNVDFRPLPILAVVGVLAVGIWWWRVQDVDPVEYHVRKGNYRLEDRRFEEAVEEFELALATDDEHCWARIGRATAFLQMGREDEALGDLDVILAAEPAFAPAHAQRGILLDRMGRYEDALASYRRALELDPDGFEGPGLIWRFLHNVSERPPTLRERADYLESELAKPPSERLLRLPEEDEKQRMYKVG